MFEDNPHMRKILDGPGDVPESREPQVSHSLDRQVNLLSELEDCISQLEIRIAPILTHPDKSQTEKELTKASTDFVELALAISTNNHRLNRTIAYIKSMISRCEL